MGLPDDRTYVSEEYTFYKIAPSVSNQMFLAAFRSNTPIVARMATSANIALGLITTYLELNPNNPTQTRHSQASPHYLQMESPGTQYRSLKHLTHCHGRAATLFPRRQGPQTSPESNMPTLPEDMTCNV